MAWEWPKCPQCKVRGVGSGIYCGMECAIQAKKEAARKQRALKLCPLGHAKDYNGEWVTPEGEVRSTYTCHTCRRLKRKASKYGITLEEAERLEQADACTICGDHTSLVVDHNHETGRTRGYLCNSCNRGIGFLKDSPKILEAAMLYLERMTFTGDPRGPESDLF